MKQNIIKNLLQKPKPILWAFLIILSGSLILSSVGYAIGSPVHDWLSPLMSETVAISYYLVLVFLVLSFTFVENIFVVYGSLIIFVWLCSFLKVASIATPRLGTAVEIILLVFMLIVLFRKGEENVA